MVLVPSQDVGGGQTGWQLDFQQYWCLPTEVSAFISPFKPQTQGHTISALICQCARHLGQCCCWELCAITGDWMWLKQDYAGWGTAHTEDVTALACLQNPITCVNYLWAIVCIIDHHSLLYIYRTQTIRQVDGPSMSPNRWTHVTRTQQNDNEP